jgi:hypothetical protein
VIGAFLRGEGANASAEGSGRGLAQQARELGEGVLYRVKFEGLGREE